MRIADTTHVKALQMDPGKKMCDFYRCLGCHRLVTLRDEQRAFRRAEATGDCRICPCGSMRYAPSWPVRTEWLGVLGFVVRLVLARAVAPVVERRAPAVLPFIERICA